MTSALATRDDAATAAVLDLERHCAAIAAAKNIDELLELRDRVAAVALLQRRRNAARSAHADTYEILQRTQLRLGQLCNDMQQHPTHGGRPKKTTTEPEQVSKRVLLAEAGILQREASEWGRLAKQFADKPKDFEKAIEVARDKVIKTGRPSSLMAASASADYDSDDYGTPDPWLAGGRELLGGGFDLDPCSNEEAQKLVRATRWWSIADDCLKQKAWKAKRLWLNPPYSDVISEIIERLLEEIDKGHVGSGLVLVNNVTDVEWFHSLLDRFPVYFTKGRIHFIAGGKPRTNTRQGQALFYHGDNVKLFKRIYETGFGGKVMVAA